MWLKGNILSLHSLQNRVVQFWMSRNSSCDKVTQFLCIFLWQYWQRTVYEFCSVFLLQIEQTFMRSIMSGKITTSFETIHWGGYYALVANFWNHMSACWGLLQSIFSGGQWPESSGLLTNKTSRCCGNTAKRLCIYTMYFCIIEST